MINLDSLLKSRGTALSTRVHLIKDMVLPVVIYGCESWTIKKAEYWRIDVFKLWCWIKLLWVTWTARRSNQPILKESESENCSAMSNSLQPHGLYSPWNSPGQNIGLGSLSLLPGIFPTQGLDPGLPQWRQVIYQLSHMGIPQNTGVSSLHLLQRIFPTHESNWDLLHCRWILYQLSYQGSTS